MTLLYIEAILLNLVVYLGLKSNFGPLWYEYKL